MVFNAVMGAPLTFGIGKLLCGAEASLIGTLLHTISYNVRNNAYHYYSELGTLLFVGSIRYCLSGLLRVLLTT